MDPSLLERIFDGIARDDLRFDHVILQWMGEPLLHPDLPRLVGIAARALQGRAGYLRVDTNGVRLTPDRVDRLLEAWLPWSELPLLVVFSLDAVRPETYTRVKGRDALAGVRQNLRALVAARRRHPGLPLNVQVQMVVQEENAAEVGEFEGYWRAFFTCRTPPGHDEILFKRLHVAGGGDGQALADRTYDGAILRANLQACEGPPVSIRLWESRPWQRDDGHREAVRGPCPGPWRTPVIRHDGDLTVCCADLQGRLSLGSLAHDTFWALWTGPRARALREAHRDRRFEGPCAPCGGIGWYALPDEEPSLP